MTPDKLRERALEWAHKIGVQPKEIRVAALRRKWGECTTDGIVTLAEDLLDCEPGFQDVCIVHELHCRIRNHGRLFRAFMTAYVPQWWNYGERVLSAHDRGKPARPQGSCP